MNVDYHLHTPLCNHARGSMEAFARRAVAAGMEEICFLDHFTLRDADPGLTMQPEEVPLYFQAVQQLKSRFNGTLCIKAGLEVDFEPKYARRMEALVHTYAFDVIGCSLHYLGDFDIVTWRSAWKEGEGDTDQVYGRYFDALQKVLDYSFFDVLCHLDLVKKFGRRPAAPIDGRIDRLLEKIREKQVAVELNTSGFEHLAREAYPSAEILKKCRQLDIPVTLGSDSHAPEHIGRHFDRAKRLLEEAGFDSLTTFTRRTPDSILI